GVQLQEALEAHRLEVRWDAKANDLPDAPPDVDAVVLDADEHAAGVAAVADRWRAVDPAPGIVVIGARPEAAGHATPARCAFVPTDADSAELARATEVAAQLRFASAMTPGLARRALGLPPDAGADAIVAASRGLDIAIPRAALAWHAHQYVAATAGVA